MYIFALLFLFLIYPIVFIIYPASWFSLSGFCGKYGEISLSRLTFLQIKIGEKTDDLQKGKKNDLKTSKTVKANSTRGTKIPERKELFWTLFRLNILRIGRIQSR